MVLDADLPTLKLIGYQEALADVPLNSLLWACKEAEKVCDYMPRPVKLRELAGKCPPVRSVPGLFNSRQISESTIQSRDEAKAALQRLMDGIENWNQSEAA